VTASLYTQGFPERPAYAEALTHALLDRVNAGELAEAVRLCVPGRLVSFGKLDAFAPGFAAAVAAAEATGFAAVHRLGGGRAAVFHEGTVLFSHVVRDEDPRRHTHARYSWLAGAVQEALERLGVDALIGSLPREYCAGDFSLHAGGIKLAGIAQRVVRRAACTQGVLVVAGGDRVRAVLGPVYAALELDWDPGTAGSLDDLRPGIAMDDALAALHAALARRLPLEPAELDAATLERARLLEPRHDASAPHPEGPDAQEAAKVRA
jgi:octanoyl-[GcvH]:protein N-octanoyltransferase